MKYWVHIDIEIRKNDPEHYGNICLWSLQDTLWRIRFNVWQFRISIRKCEKCGYMRRNCRCNDGLPF